MAYVDLHFHLLPGVDDGPSDMAASLDLARHALADGTGTIVATPHMRDDLGITDAVELHTRVLQLRSALAAAGIGIDVRCGAELGHELVGRMRQGELDLVAQGPPGRRWVLVETPFHGIGEDFHAATAELRDRGYGVLVAHPERSADASLDGSAGLYRELAAGSLAQVNAQSLTGDHGEDASTAAWELIAARQIAIVASDAHGPTRPPSLSRARRTLLEVGVSASDAESLIGSGPHRLLATGIAPAPALAA
jgi:protein-tyrosine phosphatase